jgi:hypothetical protein
MRLLLDPASMEPGLSLTGLGPQAAGSAADQHGEQAQLGATASDCLRPRGLTASTGKRTKPACAADEEEEHLHPEAGGERRRRRGPTTLVFPGEQA